MFTKDFKKDLDSIFNRINSLGHGFAFTRFADGEHACLEGLNIEGYDWSNSPENTVFKKDINSSINYRDENYYYGISCPCCDMDKYNYYKSRLSNCWDRVSYSNIFANGNYLRTLEYLQNLNKEIRVVIICNENAVVSKFPFKASYWTKYPSNLLRSWSVQRDTMINDIFDYAAEFNNTESFHLVLVCLGPASEVYIQNLWEDLDFNGKENTYILDVGSIFDPIIHNENTRIYHHHPTWQHTICNGL